MSTTETSVATTEIVVRRLAGNIGAEIQGVDTTADLSDEVVIKVRQALLDHKVVFFRDQELDYSTEVAFARRLGDLTLGHPIFASPADQPHLEEMDSKKGIRANYWHTDLTFLDRPPAFTVLHGVVIPEVGGDTIWANTVTAYESLPQPLRLLADNLRIVHTNHSDYMAVFEREIRSDPAVAALYENYSAEVFEAEHPAVRVHPETGERALLLGGFARTVVGFSPQASRDLIRLFQDYITRPEHTVRWKWRQGDLAIWDNRATQHYAVYDYAGQHRRGERVTVAGPIPIGVDGQPGRSLRGDASDYNAGAF